MIELLLIGSVALLVSVFNSIIGPSGGAFIGLLSLIITGPAAIVLHAIGALFSAASRAFLLRKYVDRKLLLNVILGSLPAIPIGILAINVFPAWVWSITIGTFLIAYTTTEFFQHLLEKTSSVLFPSFLSTLASFFVGTGGVLINPLVIERSKSPQESIANQSAIVTFQHLVKIGAFAAIGFTWSAYYSEICVLLAGVLLGNVIGSYFLRSLDLSEHRNWQRVGLFFIGFMLLLRGIYQGVTL